MSDSELKGRIHSIETFGTVDGPGTRYVVFFQGCPLRCKYCHNPDTWEFGTGQEMTLDEIFEGYYSKKGFYRNGGITATGGEALGQMKFLTALFKRAKKEGIHTCLDSSGIYYPIEPKAKEGVDLKETAAYKNYLKRLEAFEELFKVTDLVLLDIKHSDPEAHMDLTSQPMEPVLAFARALEAHNIPMSVRHVVIPGITFNKTNLRAMGEIIGSFKNVVGLEVLPYHTLGVRKYTEMGLTYPLEGVDNLGKEQAMAAKQIILQAMKEKRESLGIPL